MQEADDAGARTGWLAYARMAAIQPTAQALNIPVRGDTIGCPACKAPRRGRHDRRLPAWCKGRRWRCFVCGEWGDAAQLAAFALTGERRSAHPAVMLWFANHSDLPVVDEAEAESAPRYPDYQEVYKLLTSTLPASHNADALGWLQGRMGKLAAYAAPLARTIDERTRVPAWARWGRRPWFQAGYRLILPMYDEEGTPISVRARRYAPPGESELPKALPPEGYSMRGLVMANEMGRLMLCGVRKPGCTVVAEGEPDFLAWSAQDAYERSNCAVLGIVAGSWTQAIAARLPEKSNVYVVTHHDEAGDRYACTIANTLPSCEVTRG